MHEEALIGEPETFRFFIPRCFMIGFIPSVMFYLLTVILILFYL